MPFALDANPSQSELSDAVNYLLSNFNVTSSIDPNSGQITGPNGEILGYLYRYISIKYATSFDGTVGFSNVPTGASYFGIRNSNDATESTNPADYIWQQAAGGFGTTKFLYYMPTGNRSIQFEIDTAPPSALWIVDPGTAIDLDMLATSVVQNLQCGFVPANLLVPRSGSPLTPSFSSIAPLLYVVNIGVLVNFSAAQTDADVLFVNNSWRIGNSSSTGYADITKTGITIGDPSSATDHAVWPNPTAMASSPASLIVPIRYKTSSGYIVQINTAVQQFAFLDSGSKNGFAYLYQWNTATPGDPNGTTTFTWADNSTSAYTGTNGWFTSISSNPGTIGIQLWIASKAVVDAASATTTSVSWTTGFSKYASTGTNGSKTATVSVYQWAASIPSISGTSTYTWSDGSFTAPSGWSTTITSAPSSGFTLWKANVTLVDTTSAVTSSIGWTGASILSAGYSGANGAASRITFARVASNPAPVSGNITTVGNTSFPTSGQSTTTWGFAATWGASDPNTSSTDSLYQSDGIYDATSGITTWGTPYISSLKVGELSAITVNTGALTVSGALTVGTSGQIYSSGKTSYASTTAGFFLGYDGTSVAGYKLKLGDGTNSLGWDGSALAIVGGSITAAAFKTAASGARTEINTGTYGSSVAVYNATGIVSVIGTTGNVLKDMGSGYGLEVVATGSGYGTYSHSISGYGILGASINEVGIQGESTNSIGVRGYGVTGLYGNGSTAGIYATCSSGGVGVDTLSFGAAGIALKAQCSVGTGVYAGSVSGTALAVHGLMTIDNNTLVSNLSAEFWAGFKWATAVSSGSSGVTLSNPPTGVTVCRWLPLYDTSGTLSGYFPLFQ